MNQLIKRQTKPDSVLNAYFLKSSIGCFVTSSVNLNVKNIQVVIPVFFGENIRKVMIWLFLSCLFLSMPVVSFGGEDQLKVVLVQNRDGEFGDDLQRALRGQLAELDAKLEVVFIDKSPKRLRKQISNAERIGKEEGADAVLWHELSKMGELHLLLINHDKKSRLVERQVEVTSRSQTCEDAAIIVMSTLEAVSRGIEVGVTVTEPEQVKSKGIKPEEIKSEEVKSDNISVELGSKYGFSVVSKRDKIIHSAELSVGLRIKNRVTFGLNVRPGTSRNQIVSGMNIDERRIPAGVFISLGYSLGNWRLGSTVSGALDLTSTRVENISGTTSVSKKIVVAGIKVRALIDLKYEIVKDISLLLSFGAEFVAVNNRFYVELDAEKIAVNTIWPVAPVAMVGIEFILF